MNAEFFDALEALEKLKGIPKEYMITKVEAALTNAYRRECGAQNVRISIDQKKKEMKVYQCKTVVEEVTDPVTEISLEDAHNKSRRYELGSVVEFEMKTKV